jgi:hypothetical protein
MKLASRTERQLTTTCSEGGENGKSYSRELFRSRALAGEAVSRETRMTGESQQERKPMFSKREIAVLAMIITAIVFLLIGAATVNPAWMAPSLPLAAIAAWLQINRKREL